MWENDIDTRLAVLKPEYHIVSLRKGLFFFLKTYCIYLFLRHKSDILDSEGGRRRHPVFRNQLSCGENSPRQHTDLK